MSVYKGEGGLRSSVESILQQTLSCFEFIIINDGAPDASREHLGEIASRDSRIRLIDQPNQGLTASLIRGCNLARGEFIARQDVGDISLPHRLERQVAFLDRNPDAVVAGCWVQRIAPRGELLDVLQFPDDIDQATKQFLEQGRAPTHTATMFRRDEYLRAGGYRAAFRAAQDHDLWYRMCELGRIGYCGEVLFHWRLDYGGISAAVPKHQRRLAELAKRCAQARAAGLSEQPWLKLAQGRSRALEFRRSNFWSRREAAGRTGYFVGSMLLAQGDRRGVDYLWKAVRNAPWHVRAWLRLLSSSKRTMDRS